MSASGQPKKREGSLDFLRGTAVIFMIVTHVNGLFYSGVSPVFDICAWWGATVCFTLFLFVSGSITGIGIEMDKINCARTVRRIVRILLIYYGTAFVLKILKYGLVYDAAGVFEVLVFKDIPEFTEFLVPLLVYPLILLFTPRKMLKWLIKPLVILPLGLLLFYIANYLYALSWGDGYINVVKGILVGHEDWHRFGVLSYFPVFALGLAWGGYVASADREKMQKAAGAAFVVSSAFMFVLRFTGLSVWGRWPPSMFFILYGIVFSFLVFWVFGVVRKVKFLESAVTFAGVNAFKYYVYHIIILYIFGRIMSWKTYSEFPVLLILLFVSILSTGLIFIRNKLKIPFKLRI